MIRSALSAKKVFGLRGHAMALAFCAACLAISCGGAPPEIVGLEWRLEKRPAAGKSEPYESLSVFALVRDADGEDDTDSLWILHDESHLDWTVTSLNWKRTREGGEVWLGAAGLVMQDYAPLPRGEYRVLAADLAGERAEQSFRIDAPFPALEAPGIAFSSGRLRVTSSWPETLALAYDAAGSLIGTQPAPTAGASLEAIFGKGIAQRIVEVAAYGYDPALRMAYYSRPVKTDE